MTTPPLYRPGPGRKRRRVRPGSREKRTLGGSAAIGGEIWPAPSLRLAHSPVAPGLRSVFLRKRPQLRRPGANRANFQSPPSLISRRALINGCGVVGISRRPGRRGNATADPAEWSRVSATRDHTACCYASLPFDAACGQTGFNTPLQKQHNQGNGHRGYHHPRVNLAIMHVVRVAEIDQGEGNREHVGALQKR